MRLVSFFFLLRILQIKWQATYMRSCAQGQIIELQRNNINIVDLAMLNALVNSFLVLGFSYFSLYQNQFNKDK
jgi:hypothetical protein